MSRHPLKPCGVEYPHLPHNGTHGDGKPGSGHYFARCPGVRIPNELRVFLPSIRTGVVLPKLRDVAGRIANAVARWNVTGLYESRPRRVEEFPENDAQAWGDLAWQCTAAAAELTALATYARARAKDVERTERTRANALRGKGATAL